MTDPEPVWTYVQITDNVQLRYREDEEGFEIDTEQLALQIQSAVNSSWQAGLVRDLPRCPHGRIDGDTCSGWTGPGPFDGGCYGGVSAGNPKLPVGQSFAVGLSAMTRWVMPPREQRDDPEAWKRSAG
jgi:hypothetical protein